jgi:hypothetical protein
MRPYDGRTLEFRHTDVDQVEGLLRVAACLALSHMPKSAGLRYEISLYSGGMGILDLAAITLAPGIAAAHEVAVRLRLVTAEAAAEDHAWGEYFRWLLIGDDDENPFSIRDASARFLDRERRPFQPACRLSDPQWFAADSGVNSWSAVWEHDGAVSFLAFDQG